METTIHIFFVRKMCKTLSLSSSVKFKEISSITTAKRWWTVFYLKSWQKKFCKRDKFLRLDISFYLDKILVINNNLWVIICIVLLIVIYTYIIDSINCHLVIQYGNSKQILLLWIYSESTNSVPQRIKYKNK